MRLAIIFNRNELNRLQWQVIVENWKRVMTCHSRRAKYCNEFSNPDRIRIYHLYKTVFTPWFYKGGQPEERELTINDYQLIERAVHFFATVK
jgi:hypothetical protein